MLCVLAYGYMVLSWGGYSFIINLLPLYCLACVFFGRMTGEEAAEGLGTGGWRRGGASAIQDRIVRR